jgi:acyl carrier protein
MNREDIFKRLKILIVEKFSVQEEDILISSKFSDFDADSLDIVDLVMGIESDFDIHIPDELVEKITSVEEAIYYIQEALESK